MRKRFLGILAALAIMLGFGIAIAPAALAVPANATCNSTGPAYGHWSYEHSYPYITNVDITAPPTWCINDFTYHERLVWQANGDLVAWSGNYSGGSVLWHTSTGNRGATYLVFNGLCGCIQIQAGPTVLWQSGSFGTCPTHWQFYLKFWQTTFSGYVVDQRVSDGSCGVPAGLNNDWYLYGNWAVPW